ncbi:MAG: beta-carotene 15,15'-dioxygenase, Brp/Blh family [Sediminibacterium sp.]
MLLDQNHSTNTVIPYDYVFIGMGASNGLMLLEFIKRGYHQTKRIAVIEPQQKNTNDKTYCFWSSPNDTIVKDLSSIISHQYHFVQTNNDKVQSIQDQPYYCIKSIDFYNLLHEAIESHPIDNFDGQVASLNPLPDFIEIFFEQQVISGATVFDSRPPVFTQEVRNQSYLLQSFFGYHIRLKEPLLHVDTFQMMNFDVDQSKHTQFVYNLPYAPNECLVELTRFGVETIDIDYAKTILDEKIKAQFGAYEIVAEEEGCIPMTVLKQPASMDKRIINMGARANLIKPTTGYGFKKMHAFAVAFENPAQAPLTKGRFLFYDHLLLIILIRWPNLGKKIFTELFKNNTIQRIFSFLDEKSSATEEVKIFASLPIVPFLKACFIYWTNYIKKGFLFTMGYMLVYFLLNLMSPNMANGFGYAGLIAGLLAVGIPHGAVDHLLLASKKFSLFKFVAQYILIIAAYFMVWQWFPVFSLLLFIAYSAFHFGESEMVEMQVSMHSIAQKAYAFVLGLSILLLIIFLHLNESILVLNNMQGISDFVASLNLLQYKNIIIAVSSLMLMPLWWISKKTCFFLMGILLLGTQMPLMLAFGLYFVGSHSVNAWGHIAGKLQIAPKKLYLESLPFNVGALFIFSLFFYLQQTNAQLIQSYAAVFFVFLACLSLPHIILMHLFYKKES